MIFGNVLRASARVVFLQQRLRRRFSPPKGTSLPYQHGNPCYAYAHRFLTRGRGGDGDGDDEDWLPPDHSPLVTNAKNTKKPPSPHKNIDNDSLHQSRDEIEVIDLEATINNPLNQRLLQEDESLESTEMFSSDFEMSDVSSWKEILKELKEEGETEMMESLVKEYNLQSYLDALDDEDEDIDLEEDNKLEIVDGGEESDEEFEKSLQGLSEDELIDELIENSPSLSQLEVEIIGQEMERSEQGAQDGLDYDTLEDLDLNDNTAYRDFRAMVLEDYNEKKRLRKQIGMQEGSEKSKQADSMVGGPSATITNHGTASDFSAYPPDWRDYDSKAAFQRDFSDDDDSWIPPSTGMIQSRSLKLDQLQQKCQQSPLKDAKPSTDDLDGTIDWLQARRSRLGDGSEDNKQIPTHMLSPDQGEKFAHQNSQIAIVKHTLFTTTELSTSLAAQGGTDISFIDTEEFNSMYGVGIGCKFIMLVTGRGASHIRVLADSVVRNLKARKLHERGVLGAMQGAEGGQDIFSNKRSRNRARRNGATNASRKVDDDWMVVDCDNIHVHIMEATTRKCLNIEGLWDLADPNSEGSKLRRVNFNDDEDVDTYVSENPIPDEYAAKIFNDGGGGGWITGGPGGRILTVPAFQSRDTRKSFSEKWRGAGGKRNRQRGKR